MPVHRAYRCVGDPPKFQTQHGCCPDDDQPVDSVGRPCCEPLPAVAVSVVTLSHDAASVPPPAIAFVPLSSSFFDVNVPVAVRIRGGTSPPFQQPRTSTVLRI
jgi:hypothetical protein